MNCERSVQGPGARLVEQENAAGGCILDGVVKEFGSTGAFNLNAFAGFDGDLIPVECADRR